MRPRTAFVILPFLVGCEVLFPVIEASIDGASDVATQNDTGTSDASDASTDATNDVAIDTSSPNLLLNAGFENGTTLCGDNWTFGANATISFSSYAHTGQHSCFVCSSSNTGVQQPVTVAFDAGASFALTAYVAMPGEAGAPKVVLSARAMYIDSGTGEYLDQPSTLDDSGVWVQYADPITTKSAGTGFLISVYPGGPDYGCILVDDVSLTAN